MTLPNLGRTARHNLATLRRQPLAEISGALGDLGTLLPLLAALSIAGSVDLGASLVFGGAWNVLTGVWFGVPLPVQPMKAIAAAAMANSSSASEVAGAGQIVGMALLVASASGALRWCVATIPVPIVKGIQLGAGLSLVMSAGSSLLGPLGWVAPAPDNRVWALCAFLLLICTERVLPRFPYALVVFSAGLGIALVGAAGAGSRLPSVHVWVPRFGLPGWLLGLAAPMWAMALGQAPLTLLNSVIATAALSAGLLPEVAPAPSAMATALGLSVAAMNLTGTWFGAMPVCHGSGGLAAQYRFGARSGASVILLGVFKLVVGLVFGDTLVDLLRRYPRGLLGVMVVAAGLELAKVGGSLDRGASGLGERPGEEAERWNVMLVTAGGMLAFRNDAVGLLAGLACHGAYRLADRAGGGNWFREVVRVVDERDPLLR